MKCTDRSPDTKNQKEEEKQSCVMVHLLPVTCHLTTTLRSFICYESPRWFVDAAVGRFGIDIITFCLPKKSLFYLVNLWKKLLD